MGVIVYNVTLSEGHKEYKETLMPHLVATLIYLSKNYSYYISINFKIQSNYVMRYFFLDFKKGTEKSTFMAR